MNTAMTKESLAQILDQALQEVTECTAGVHLHQGGQLLGEDLCTVHITFDKGFNTSLTLCADTSLLARMARNSFHEDDVTPEDLEEFSKEYLNVLCGRVTGAMFRATQIPAHFGQPVFYHGRYEPEEQEIQFILTYSDECSEGAQLIHHVPCSQEDRPVPNDTCDRRDMSDERTHYGCGRLPAGQGPAGGCIEGLKV